MRTRSLLVTRQINVVDDVATGARIRSMRERLGITQTELAKRIGLSAPHVNNLESGKRGFSQEIVEKIKVALAQK